MKLVFGLEPKQTSRMAVLRHATQCFTASKLPVYVRAPHFSRREKVCVYDGPRARITFADKSHARFQFQRSIEPRYGMRSASFYFDLNDLRHAFSALNMPPPAKRVRISRLGSFRSSDDMSHSRPQRLTGQARSRLELESGGRLARSFSGVPPRLAVGSRPLSPRAIRLSSSRASS
jgi:hypothetical protein